MKKIFAVFLSILILAGCGAQPQTGNLEIRDDLGTILAIPKATPGKIISLTPNMTEIACFLGLKDSLIGRSSYCNYPPEVKDILSVGDPLTLSIEKIVELNPDLVLANRMIPIEAIEKLKNLGIKVAAFDPQTVEGVIDTINRIAMICAVPPNTENLKAELDSYKKAQSGRLVYIEIWNDPPTTYGKDTFGADMARWVGTKNLGDELTGSYPNTTNEALVKLNPEIVVLPTSNPKAVDDFKARPGFGSMKAVTGNMVFTINEDIMSRPGPRILEAIKALSGFINP